MNNRVVWSGRYAVFDEIASGGMASVYLACRLEPGGAPRVVAIKKMFESFAKRPEFVTMFLDEAHIAARIRHPNVVTTFEFLRIPDSLGIVMEFVLGVPLVDLARIASDSGRPPPVGVSVAIVRDMLAGLHAAHEAKDEHGQLVGLVHRDVSPHNVIVSKEGVGRVIDFGIAKAAGRLQVTEVGVMKGKFAYMAPEQIRAAALDRTADIYGAGIVLWEAITGQALFRGSADAELFSKRGKGTAVVPSPRTLRDGVSADLEAVVHRALEFDPKERFASAQEMAHAMVAAATPAPPNEVADWVQKLAGSRLRELEAKRNEVETAYAAGELVSLSPTQVGKHAHSSPAIFQSSAAIMTAPVAVALPAPPLPDLELDIPRPAAKPPPSKPAGKGPPPPPPPKSRRPPSMADQSAYEDVFGESGGASLKLDLDVPMPSRPISSSPSLDARASRASVHALPSRAERHRGGAAGAVLLLLLLGLAGAAYVLGPEYLKTSVIAAAGRRGLTLSARSVEPRSGGFTLSGVTLALPGMKQMSATASEVGLDLDWDGNVRKITVPGYELSVHGGVSEVASSFAAWRAGPRLPVKFEAKAGHLVWTDLVIPGAQAEGINVALTVGAIDDGSLSLDAPSLTLTVPRGNLGPWRAHLDSTADETKLTVSLDRSKQEGPPRIQVVQRPALGLVLTATVPRTKLVQIGVPADFFLAGADPEVDLSLEAQIVPSGNPVNGHAIVTLFGVSAGPTAAPGAPVDLLLDGTVHGDPAQPLFIEQGALAIGKVKSRMTGRVTIASDRVRVEVDRPVGKATVAPPPFVLDTHDWTAGKTAPPAPAPATSASAPAAPSSKPRK